MPHPVTPAPALELPPYREGSVADRNTGRACWSCAGMMGCAPGVLGIACVYPDSHGTGVHADAVTPS